MTQFTVATISLGLSTLLGFFPHSESVAEVLPYVQVSAFTVVALNNGLQFVKQLNQDNG